MEFNLSLDINNLKQEIRHLELREQLLQSKRVARVVSPQERAVLVTREILYMMKDGVASLLGQGQKALDFIKRLSDPYIATGHGSFDVGAFLQRVRRFDAVIPLTSISHNFIQAFAADHDTITTVMGFVNLLFIKPLI